MSIVGLYQELFDSSARVGAMIWVPSVSDALLNARRSGFLFRGETPIYRWHADGSADFGWGRYHTQWIYAPSEEAIQDRLLAWANRMHEADKSTSGSAQGGQSNG